MNAVFCLSLQASTETLVTLNLGHNNITNEGVHRIKDGLLKNKSMLRLGLQGIKITCEGLFCNRFNGSIHI